MGTERSGKTKWSGKDSIPAHNQKLSWTEQRETAEVEFPLYAFSGTLCMHLSKIDQKISPFAELSSQSLI